jgi:hypothetical protein
VASPDLIAVRLGLRELLEAFLGNYETEPSIHKYTSLGAAPPPADILDT